MALAAHLFGRLGGHGLRRDLLGLALLAAAVDEAHRIFSKVEDGDAVNIIDFERRVLFSDASQSDGQPIAYPEGADDGKVHLTEVVRSSERIATQHAHSASGELASPSVRVWRVCGMWHVQGVCMGRAGEPERTPFRDAANEPT